MRNLKNAPWKGMAIFLGVMSLTACDSYKAPRAKAW